MSSKKVTARKKSSSKKATKKNTKKSTKKAAKKTAKKITKKQTTVKKKKKPVATRKKKAKKKKSSTKKRVSRTRRGPNKTPSKATTSPIIHKKNFSFDSRHYFNRDISWLDFNARVLNEAFDKRTPLLERLRFLNIWRSNNDEFFMKRVGALFNKLENGDLATFVSGHTASELYEDILSKITYQQQLVTHCFQKEITPLLNEEGIKLLKWSELTAADKELMLDYFKNNIYPILTPLAVDSGHPFPFISNLSKSIGVCLRKPRERTKQFARVKVPNEIPQWVRLAKHRQHERSRVRGPLR